MQINVQTTLSSHGIAVIPLQETDFEALYLAASDPEIWQQHPNKERYKRDVFLNFFDGAMRSRGAFKIVDTHSNTIIGSTRFYEYSADQSSILIGYTFYKKKCWGKGINQLVKTLMLDYIFTFVSQVFFHVGAENIRSQIAMSKLGAQKIEEVEVAYFGEQPKLNFVYLITKDDWSLRQK